jgi:excisionase family DNA binding protein
MPTKAKQSKKSADRLLTTREAAERLGLNQITLRSWAAQRRIAYFKVGPKSLRFAEAEIERLLAESYVPAR